MLIVQHSSLLTFSLYFFLKFINLLYIKTVMKLYFVTSNKKKFEEARTILSGIELKQLNIMLPEMQDIRPKKIIRAKLLEALKHKKTRHGKDVGFIVEDTSLHLRCLNGLPGPFVKWFLLILGNDGLFRLVKKLGDGRAVAKTIIGYAQSPDKVFFFEGKIHGRIVQPEGRPDFGWDPIFQPQGFTKSFAKLSKEEKNRISMRRKALDRLKLFLIKHQKKS